MYAHILLKGYWTHESDSYNSDKEAAMYLLQPMAEAGLPAAQFDIGYYFYYSEACAIEKHLYAEKAKWILKACKQNYPPAIEYINYLYVKYLYSYYHLVIYYYNSINCKRKRAIKLLKNIFHLLQVLYNLLYFQ